MSLGATLGTSLRVALAHPSTWALALATFLVRGGIVVIVAPIVALPSAVGLGNAIAPALTAIVFGTISFELILVGAASALALFVWLITGGLFAAAAELESVETVAAEERVPGGRRRSTTAGRSRRARRILMARLIGHVPTVIAAAWGGARLTTMAYRELTLPTDVASPIVLRVVRDAPEAVAVIVGAWFAGELIGGLATRRIALASAGVFGGLRGALARIIRHPFRSAILMLVPVATFVLVALPWAIASSLAWNGVRASLEGSDMVTSAASMIVFLGLWGGGLVVLALLGAWRSAVWTVDSAGTFGVGTDRREGG